MSRTFRRRKTGYNYWWVCRDYCWDRPFQYDRHSIEGRKKIALYHSDAGFGDYSHKPAPHWYRRLLNKKCTRQERAEVHLWLLRGEEGFEVPKFKRVKDASYYW